MKYALTILIIELASLSYGQTLADLGKRLRLLENRTDFELDTTGFSSLPKVDYFCDSDNGNESDYYHVTDLNQDGSPDLIYSGPCKPYNQTGIFLRNEQGLKQIHSYPGKIVSIDKSASETVINILKEACCCDYYSEYIEITIDKESNIRKKSIFFSPNTKIKLGNRLKKDKVMGTIRSTPEINDNNKKDDCRDEIIKGNRMIQLYKFSDIIQLNSYGQWWLVLYPENSERSWVGWMKIN